MSFNKKFNLIENICNFRTKRLLLFFILLITAFDVLPYTFSEYNSDGKEIYYYVVDGYDEYAVEVVMLSVVYSGEINIPNKVSHNGYSYTVIGIYDGAFESCRNLTRVTIPSTIQYIGKNAFNGCSNLQLIDSKITKPTNVSLDSSAFGGITSTCTLKVPVNTSQLYKQASQWKNFTNIIEDALYAPSFSRLGNYLTMSCTNTEASIYYTLDGKTPTTSSSVYTTPVLIEQNCTAKALSKLGNSQSSVSSYTVNWYTTPNPTITYSNLKVNIRCTDINAKIYYTLDGTNPTSNSSLYVSPFDLVNSCLIKAIAVRDGYPPSNIITFNLDISKWTCSTPKISQKNDIITISCDTPGTNIYYSTDGNIPNITSNSRYIESFGISRDCTIKALATKSGYINSNICSYYVDYFKVAEPEISYENLNVNIQCSTPNASIYYTLNGSDPDTSGRLYIAPISVKHNCTVKAIAKKDNYMDSDVVSLQLDLNDYISPTPTISFLNGRVFIKCIQEEAKIFYTTDGTTPTTNSTSYNGIFSVDENCTIKAIASYEGLLNSFVAEYKIDSYKVATPMVVFANLQVHITCGTSNASIYYTLNGSDPNTNGTLYSAPISVTQNCMVKAIAKRNNYHDSYVATYNVDVDSYTCPKPTFTLINNTLKIECLESGSKIRYTVDGTTPSSSSAVYTSPITLEHNCVVKAYAEKSGYINSEVASCTVDWFKTEMPSFSFSGGYLTISSSTPEAKIYYTIGGSDPSQTSILYTSPIKLTDNRQVKARAYADDINPSDVAIYTPDGFTCEAATVSYNGKYITLATATQGARIYYTTNGSYPSSTSRVYSSPFDIGGIGTVRAIVMKDAMNNSKFSSYTTPSYFNGEMLIVDEYGTASKAFEWCDRNNITDLTVLGKVNGYDIAVLAALPKIAHLDMSNVSVLNNTLDDNAFANTTLVSIQLPQGLQSVGSGIFNGCTRLAAIVWKANVPLTPSSVNGIKNPNLLLYVKMKSMAPSSIRNVIVNNVAENITLSDSDGVADFYCPIEFLAKHISYGHQYTQKSIINVCSGWETLALPFDVKSVRHSRAEEIAPFTSDNMEANSFWLYALSTTGFEPSSAIEANTPYIISMPNNDSYADDYILAGDVTFSSDNVYVPVTTQNIATKGEISFVPTMCKVDKDIYVYPINKYEAYEGHPEGSMFVSDLRNVNPFEAYLTFEYSSPRQMKALGIFDVNDISYELPIVAGKYADFNAYAVDGVLYIETGLAQRVDIFTMSGMLIRSIDVEPGVTKVEDLTQGIYLVRNIKILIK